ncbi:3-isopropylmalate dehydratase, large subunit [Anopheles sinensis]|uniref:3-isopropylmalate dehydratase, large subunit n=1 Tax=Anopheles sinensis TaxID=74873 RepID=A0A084VQG0_ANOSI|nr:3-isopropylmalate dehydratase, large subunit [Anopheles sinensis]
MVPSPWGCDEGRRTSGGGGVCESISLSRVRRDRRLADSVENAPGYAKKCDAPWLLLHGPRPTDSILSRRLSSPAPGMQNILPAHEAHHASCPAFSWLEKFRKWLTFTQQIGVCLAKTSAFPPCAIRRNVEELLGCSARSNDQHEMVNY